MEAPREPDLEFFLDETRWHLDMKTEDGKTQNETMMTMAKMVCAFVNAIGTVTEKL